MSEKMYIRLEDEFRNKGEAPLERFALDVLMGLTSKPKSVSPKYLYDAVGSELFQKITDTKDYYPTACETEILEVHKEKIINAIQGEQLNVVELGAGDGRKTKILMDGFCSSPKKVVYRPIDISESAVDGITQTFKKLFPSLNIKGIVSEYFEALRWLRDQDQGRNVVLFLGSNIGNFNKAGAEVFLRTLWNSLNHGDYLLLGVDLKKDIDTMLLAYNDSEGYTKRFNLNLLTRMNNELGADFDCQQFEHFGTYNTKLGAMESFILSKSFQEVHIKALNKKFRFKPYEPIHVEFSFKFLQGEVAELAKDTGFSVVDHFIDSKKYFVDALLQVEK